MNAPQRLAFALVAALAAAGCDRSPSAAHCGDHLGGIWETADGSARWHVLDGGDRLQAFPLVRELPVVPSGMQASPSRLDLRRIHSNPDTSTYLRRCIERLVPNDFPPSPEPIDYNTDPDG